jgi:hypothetical protein
MPGQKFFLYQQNNFYRRDMMTTISTRLEKLLSHLKSSEPHMDNWMQEKKVRLPKGFLKKNFRKDRDAQIEGLLLAIELLAKKCAYLESQLPREETKS